MNEKKWQLNSAVYHAVDGMLFQNNNLFFKVKYLLKGSQQRTSQILNEPQLKRSLYNQIKKKYDQRITNYDLNFSRLKEDGEDILDVKLYQPVEKDLETGEYKDESGKFSIYPRSFYCNVCQDFIILDNSDKAKKIYSNKCQNKTCNGSYRQIPMVKFCSECGKIDEIYYQCKCEDSEKERKAGRKAPIKFKWAKWDDPRTWKFECTICQKTEDFLKLPCYHKDYGKSISNKKPSRYSPMSLIAGQGGGPKPFVVNMVDIPPMKTLKHPKREKVLCAIISGKLDFLRKKAEELNRSIIELIDSNYETYNNEITKKQIINANKMIYPNKTIEELEKEFDRALEITAVESVLNESSSPLPSDEILAEIINFHSLKGTFSNELGSSSYKNKIIAEKDASKLEKTENIFKKNKIVDINYISNLRMISSCIGTINGNTHREGEKDFIPHFNPLWDYQKKKIHIYCNPYNTEGLLIEFDKKEILRWVGTHLGKIYSGLPEESLMNLKETDEEYQLIYKLLHTLSHLLIKKSETFTGIDVQSCGEMILPTNASILIYSTNTVNIGGFGSLFEQGILDLIKETDFEMRNCIYDPLCLDKEGSCFSCIYLPEHVCCKFNNSLDRDILLGTGKRYKEGFW